MTKSQWIFLLNRRHAMSLPNSIQLINFLKHLLTAAIVLSVWGCKQSVPEACPPFPREDGFTYATAEGAVKLKLPNWVNAAPTYDCKQIRSIDLGLLWYRKKLHPIDGEFELSVPSKDYHRVLVMMGGFGETEEFLKKSPRKNEQAWRFENKISHGRLPLEMYPKYFWDTSSAPSSRKIEDVMWGIKNTRDPITDMPVQASCSISPSTKDPRSIAYGKFADHGDSKCMVYLNIVKGKKAARATVYVWAHSAQDIDQIVNGIQVELTNLIQEE